MMTRLGSVRIIVAAVFTALIAAAPAGAQEVTIPPFEIAVSADINPETLSPPATVTPGIAVTVGVGERSAVEVSVFLRRYAGEVVNPDPDLSRVDGLITVRFRRYHQGHFGPVQAFHTFGAWGGFQPDTDVCCIEIDHAGNVIRDTRRTSMAVLPPILPFAGLGFEVRTSRRTRVRLEADAGVFFGRATLTIGVPIGHLK
jgi:hypothetical protein